MTQKKGKKDVDSEIQYTFHSVNNVNIAHGDINIDRISNNNLQSNQEKFLEELRKFRIEIAKINVEEQQEKLFINEVSSEIDSIEKSMVTGNSDKAQVENHLEKTRKLLVDSSSVITASGVTLSAIQKLMPHIDKLVELAKAIF